MKKFFAQAYLWLLLLILYLMYRESGDQELLIIMGAMFLL